MTWNGCSVKKLKTPRRVAREKALWLFTRTERPVLVGQLCLLLPYYSLDEAESILMDLMVEGKIRLLTDKEKKHFDVRHGFMLV